MDLLDHAVTMSLTGASNGVLIPGLPEDKRRQVGYSVVFPNLLISPHPDYVMTHQAVRHHVVGVRADQQVREHDRIADLPGACPRAIPGSSTPLEAPVSDIVTAVVQQVHRPPEPRRRRRSLRVRQVGIRRRSRDTAPGGSSEQW